MIKIYTGNAGSGKTTAMKKDVAKSLRSNFICIDEGNFFLEDNPDFNIDQFLNDHKTLFITLQNPRPLIKRIPEEKRKFIEIFTISRPKD